MSLLLKALRQAERNGGKAPSGLSLEPMEPPKEAPPRPAQAAADLIRAHGEAAGRRRLLILFGLLVLVLVGMGGYFYVAVYMPWLLLPPPPAPAATLPPLPRGTASAEEERLSASPLPPAPGDAGAGLPAPPPLSQADGRALASGSGAKPVEPPRAEPWVRPGRPEDGARDEMATAHALLTAGRLDDARAAYERLRVLRPDEPDVWLGLAAIAEAEQRHDEAVRFYVRVLELDGRNPYARAGLAALLGRADPALAEARLRQLAAEQPAGYPYSVLGSLLAAQNRWSDAEQAYFEAHRLEPEVADHAFNLAVSLEHLGESRAAADYYARALELAEKNPATAHFDPGQARARLRKLSSSP